MLTARPRLYNYNYWWRCQARSNLADSKANLTKEWNFLDKKNDIFLVLKKHFLPLLGSFYKKLLMASFQPLWSKPFIDCPFWRRLRLCALAGSEPLRNCWQIHGVIVRLGARLHFDKILRLLPKDWPLCLGKCFTNINKKTQLLISISFPVTYS